MIIISQPSRGIFDQNNIIEKAQKLEQESLKDDFWNDTKRAAIVMEEKTRYQRMLDALSKIQSLQEDIKIEQEYPELANPNTLEQLFDLTRSLYIQCAFDDECDSFDCYLHIQAGAGGLESEDWAVMLMNMYVRFCEKEGYGCTIVDLSPSEHPGLINKVILEITTQKQTMPYGWLKHEHGIHRLVRISPFDSNNRRHTSFASVWITPKLNTQVEVDINPSDLQIRECRASGAGGQHVNKTNSAIEIIHKPTGISAQSQQERSQHQNREIALSMLRSKLYVHFKEQLAKDNAKHIMNKTDVSWGNQIRSYTLAPDQRIKDRRTGLEIFDTQSVLEGDIKPFMLACLEMQNQNPSLLV